MGRIAMNDGLRRLGQAVILASVLAAPAVAETAARTPPPGLSRLENIVVIYLENHSFDNLFGKFAGADGLANADGRAAQVDKDGRPYKTLPPVLDAAATPPKADPRFPTDLPNRPFSIDKYVAMESK